MKNNYSYFGIVEGFFSSPLPMWTSDERNTTIRFVSKYAKGINAYLYCPKNDPYVTSKPFDLYPETLLREFSESSYLCKQGGIRFIYGLNPVFDDNSIRDKSKTIKRVVNKMNQLLAIGVRDLCLLFDDIPLAYDVFSEQSEFDERDTRTLVEIVNEVYKTLESKIDSMWFCSPDYNFLKQTNVTKALANLNPNIRIFWTGNEIFSRKKTLSDLRRVKRITNSDNIALWDNYPVNDAEQNLGYFNLGGYYSVSRSVREKLAGIFVNPMREAYANLPFYISFSNWIENQDSYTRESSYKQALQLLDIPNEAYQVIEIFRQKNNFDKKTYKNMQSLFSQPIYPRSSTKFGTYYLDALQPLFKEWNSWTYVIKKIKSSQLISETELECCDKFPTRTDVPRYIDEISLIIETRFRLYEKLPIPDSIQQSFTFIKVLNKKYFGKKWLKMSIVDRNNALKAIDKLTRFERKIFLKFLNNPQIPRRSKVKILLKRRDTNRFSFHFRNNSAG